MEDQNPDNQNPDNQNPDNLPPDGDEEPGGDANPGDVPAEDLHKLHWSALKKMLEAKGLTYESKEQAIAALSGGSAGPSAGSEKVLKVGGKFLDKSFPYGDIFGEVENAPGARYIQGGNLYNTEGEKVG